MSHAGLERVDEVQPGQREQRPTLAPFVVVDHVDVHRPRSLDLDEQAIAELDPRAAAQPLFDARFGLAEDRGIDLERREHVAAEQRAARDDREHCGRGQDPAHRAARHRLLRRAETVGRTADGRGQILLHLPHRAVSFAWIGRQGPLDDPHEAGGQVGPHVPQRHAGALPVRVLQVGQAIGLDREAAADQPV